MTPAEIERIQEPDFHERLAAIMLCFGKGYEVRLSVAARFTGISAGAFIQIWSRLAPEFIRPKGATLN